MTIQFLLFTHSDFEHGSINCSPVDPVVIRRNDKHCFNGSASVPSNLQASKDEKVKKLNSTSEMSSLIKEFKKTTKATATGPSINKRFDEQSKGCTRAL